MERKTHNWVPSKINFLVGSQEPLLTTVKRQKLAWSGHVTRHDNLFKTILQGAVEAGDAVVGTRNAEWTKLNSGHPCICQNCQQ